MAAQTRNQKFDEIDVERINIVERDGKIKLVIANKERLPGPVMGGKTYERVGLKSPGILFYNDKGDESGGLRTASTEGSGKYVAGGGLAFDKYDGDEVIGMRYNDENGSRTVGLRILESAGRASLKNKRGISTKLANCRLGQNVTHFDSRLSHRRVCLSDVRRTEAQP